MRRALIVVGAMFAGCAASAPTARVTTPHPAVQPIAAGPAGPLWERIAPRDLPTPISSIAALSGDAAVIAAGDGVYVWRESRAVPICTDATPAPRVVQADGSRVLALSEFEGQPRVWRSVDLGATCVRVDLPPMFVRSGRSAIFSLSLEGDDAVVWSTSGAIAASVDAGATWTRVPDLPGATRVARGAGAQLVAAFAPDPVTARGVLRLATLSNPSAQAWLPIADHSERRSPLAMRRGNDGTVRIADGLGTATLTPQGQLVDVRIEPAYHARSDAPVALVPLDADRFVAASPGILSAIDANGLHPFAALPSGVPTVLAVAPDGAVWTASAVELHRGQLGHAEIVDVTQRPLPRGMPRAIAVDGARLAVVANGRDVSQSNDRGAHWTREELPDDAGEPVACAFGRLGELLVLTSNALYVGDGTALLRAQLPPRSSPRSAPPALHVSGDRWIVVDGAVLVSDDQGAQWQAKLGAGESDAPAVAAAFVRDAGLVIDASYQLWR